MFGWLFDPLIFFKLVTALFALGAIRSAFLMDWPMTGYQACASGLQIFVMMMEK